MPQLTIREQGAEKTYVIESERTTIGRGEHNNVLVGDPRASKEHCEIVEVDGRWKLVDLESHNGTRVNGEFRNKAWLAHEDRIAIGQSEIRFGLERGARAAPSGASRVAAAAPGRAAEDEDALPPPRRRSPQSGGEKVLVYGGALLGAVLLFVLATQMGIGRDEHNEKVLEEANKLVSNGQIDDAQLYLQEHADRGGTLYGKVMDRIAELEKLKPGMQRTIREREALQLLSRMANKIANYNRGGSADPAVILEMMNRLKSEYAGTEQEMDAARTYPEWYAGQIPEPGVDRSNPRRKLAREWEEACAQAEDYRKKEHFREARETLERFVRVRETTLEKVDLEWLNQELEKRRGNIERLAGTYFSSTERRAADLVKNKRFDQAIDLYRHVIDNYGIDRYVRKAKEAIAEIEEAKRKDNEQGGKGGG